MQDDDLYPLNGEFVGGVPLEPKEQVLARQKEKAQTLEAKKEIEKIIAHLEERIAYRGLIDSVDVDLTDSPEMYQKVMEVNKLLKIALEEEKELLEELLEVHVR